MSSASDPFQNIERDVEDDIDEYNKLLLESYDQTISLKDNFLQELDSDSQSEFGGSMSIKSLQKSVKSISSRSFFSRSGKSSKQDSMSQKAFKQEQKRIKQQLKDEEKKEKQNMDIFNEKGKKISKKLRPRGRKLKLTRRTLELLSKKFEEFTVRESRYEGKDRGISIRQIGQLFDMGSSTVHKLYNEWMSDSGFQARFSKESQKKKNPQRKCTLQRLQQINRLIKQNPFMTQNEITVALNKIDGLKYVKNGKVIDITRTTVARLLKVGKFKKKRVKCVPKQRNTSKSFQKRYDYCTRYKQIRDKGARIFFLDQSGFNLYMTRDKAWARPNEQITVNCPISKGKRFSVIAVIGIDGLAHWRIIQGTYRKYEYIDFVKQVFARMREEDQANSGNQEYDRSQKWLILDNCAIHDKEQTVKLAAECDMQILYLPPYSPQLNPIQYWFHEVKSEIRKYTYQGEKQLLQIMHRTLSKFQNKSFTEYYSGVNKHVQKGIKKERF